MIKIRTYQYFLLTFAYVIASNATADSVIPTEDKRYVAQYTAYRDTPADHYGEFLLTYEDAPGSDFEHWQSGRYLQNSQIKSTDFNASTSSSGSGDTYDVFKSMSLFEYSFSVDQATKLTIDYWMGSQNKYSYSKFSILSESTSMFEKISIGGDALYSSNQVFGNVELILSEGIYTIYLMSTVVDDYIIQSTYDLAYQTETNATLTGSFSTVPIPSMFIPFLTGLLFLTRRLVKRSNNI